MIKARKKEPRVREKLSRLECKAAEKWLEMMTKKFC